MENDHQRHRDGKIFMESDPREASVAFCLRLCECSTSSVLIMSSLISLDEKKHLVKLIKRSHFLLVCSKRSPKHYSSAIFFYFTLMVILIVQNERKTGVTRTFPLVLIHQSSPHKFKLNIPHRATS